MQKFFLFYFENITLLEWIKWHLVKFNISTMDTSCWQNNHDLQRKCDTWIEVKHFSKVSHLGRKSLGSNHNTNLIHSNEMRSYEYKHQLPDITIWSKVLSVKVLNKIKRITASSCLIKRADSYSVFMIELKPIMNYFDSDIFNRKFVLLLNFLSVLQHFRLKYFTPSIESLKRY